MIKGKCRWCGTEMEISKIKRHVMTTHAKEVRLMPLLGQRDARFIVRYPDGKKSERMDERTAKEYADMFNGSVECVQLLTRRERFERVAVGCVVPVLTIVAVLMIGGLVFVAMMK